VGCMRAHAVDLDLVRGPLSNFVNFDSSLMFKFVYYIVCLMFKCVLNLYIISFVNVQMCIKFVLYSCVKYIV
jgi:hypothetical protein